MSDGGPRLVTVGMSTSVSCGARDHAKLLSGALERLSGEPSPMYWLERRDLSASGSRREIGRWTDQLALSLRAEAATVAVLHYSVFSYSHRGVPLFADRVLRTLRRSRVQVLTVLHEYAYPWQARDPRGNVWALTQRAALVDVLYTSDAALLTAELRVPWLSTRQWLPRRPIAVAPVFPNLPPPAPAAGEQRASNVIGLFGYAYESARTALVLDAIAALRTRHHDVRLLLLGSPGSESDAGERWSREARRRGISEQLAFTNRLPAQELSDALARCGALIFADHPGPTSRKGTLAAALQSGAPVIATDGPRTWQALRAEDAVRVVAPSAEALADGLAGILAEPRKGAALGRRGQAFATAHMSVERTAEVLADLLRG